MNNYFSYKLRIEIMLLKAEFEANMGFLEPSIESMLAAGQGRQIDIKTDRQTDRQADRHTEKQTD